MDKVTSVKDLVLPVPGFVRVLGSLLMLQGLKR